MKASAYILAGKRSLARAERIGADRWRLTGHARGVQVPGDGREYVGPDADQRCWGAAMALAFRDRLPGTPPGSTDEPCALCRTLTLPDFLEDPGELATLPRGGKCCPECIERLERERAEEERAHDFDARQTLEMGLR